MRYFTPVVFTMTAWTIAGLPGASSATEANGGPVDARFSLPDSKNDA